MTGIWRMGRRQRVPLPGPAVPLRSAGQRVDGARLGATAVVLEQFDARLFLDTVERFAVTHSQVVPTMFSRLLKLRR